MDDPTRPTLSRLEPSLPSRSYFDLEQYQRELEAIWCEPSVEFRQVGPMI